MEKLGFSVEEFRRAYGVGRNTAYELVKRSDFPAVRIGRRIVIPVDALKKWMADHVQGGENEWGIQ